MIYILIVVYMAVTGRMSGGGLGAHLLNKRGTVGPDGKDLGGIAPFNLTWLPEVLFSLPFGWVLSTIVGPWGWLAAVWSYVCMQTSTEPGFNINYKENKTLIPYVNAIAKVLGIKPHTLNYMRLWNAVKGFLIGLPVGGVVLAALWPLGYEIGRRVKRHEVSELLSGAGAGISICIIVALSG